MTNNGNFVVDNQLSPSQLELRSLIDHLLIVLSDKEKYIIESRFALSTPRRQTLEEIGHHFGVTRERIRQIEKSALRKLERNAQNTNIRILSEYAKAHLRQEGGVLSDEAFKSLLMKSLPNISEEQLHDLHLALVLDPEINFTSNTLKFHPFWQIKDSNDKLVKKVSECAIKALKKAKRVLSEAQIANTALKQLELELSENQVHNILLCSKECKYTDDGFGLYSWRHIHPRTLRDKINFVLRREKKALHFQKIAELISEADFDTKRVNVQAVHNELIRNDQFVLIGRGIYALSEWGYKTGTVADVIEQVLSDGIPKTRDEITKSVLAQRQVKTITIYLNLKNKSEFVRVGRDKYTLAQFSE